MIVVFKEFSKASIDYANRLKFPLKVGDIILRPVVFYETWTERMGKVVFPQVLSPKFRRNDKKQLIIKVQKWGNNYVATEKKRGIIVFCSFELDPLWTHLEVTSIGQSGKCAFVKPVDGNEAELIAKFK